jgi:HAD superfamily hydrolase (TIGR01509 family)
VTVVEHSPIALLVDIDGTLVDSNYLHIDAWQRAFAEAGSPTDSWQVHRAIGMDSKKLLGELLGDDASRLGDEAKRLHQQYYAQTAPRLRAFAGARELLREVSRRGGIVVLATSAPEEELKLLRDVLDVEDTLDHVTSAEDVEAAKPEPDLVKVALDKAGVSASQALFLGDTIWDVEAAARAGVRCIGVLSGGVSEAALTEAGAIAVYPDVAALLHELDASPLGVALAT